MRHSFASYHLAKFHDAPRTALELGQTGGLDILFRHYRSLVTEAQAEQYFATTVKEPSKNPPKHRKGKAGVE